MRFLGSHDGRQVDGRAGTDTLGVVALAEQTVDAAHRELLTKRMRWKLTSTLDWTLGGLGSISKIIE